MDIKTTIGRKKEMLRQYSLLPGAASAISVLLFSFLAAKVKIGPELRPFGIAFILVCFLNAKAAYSGGAKTNPYLAMAGVFGALCTDIPSLPSIAFSFSLVAVLGILMSTISAIKLKIRRYTAMLAAAAVYIPLIFIFKLNMPSSAAWSLLELALCAVSIIIFDSAVKVLTLRRKLILTDEESFSFVFGSAVLLVGLGSFGIIGAGLANMAFIFISLCLSFFGGPALGCGAGVICGAASLLSGKSSLLIALLALPSLFSGCARKLGKYPCALVYFFSELLLSYAIPEFKPLLGLAELILAALGFMLLPKKYLNRIGRFINTNLMRESEQEIHAKRFRELTLGRLKEISSVFASAGKIFTQEKKEKKISYMLSLVPERACKGCLFFDSCWDRGFESSYLLMQNLYDIYEKKGKITKEDFGEDMGAKCIRLDRLLLACRDVFSKYIENSRIEEKIMKSRRAVGDQMYGISKVINSLCGDVDLNLGFHEELEDAVKEEMDRIGIRASEICVEINRGSIRASLRIKAEIPYGAREGMIREAVSKGCGVQMSYVPDEIGSLGGFLTYEEMKEFRLACGVACVKKSGSEASGDTYSFEKLRDGRQMLLLCDGMGSGKKAAAESIQAVSLVEDFYKAGFDDDTVLNAINRLLMLSSSDEIFSTMDMCMVKLTTGLARFTKIGAPHSYLIRGGYSKKLSAGSLPMGIIDEFEPAYHDIQLKDGDIIIMFTDGIADLENRDSEMFNIITEAIELHNPQDIAKEIANRALELSSGLAADDMTVIAAKVYKLSADERIEKKAA